MTWAELKKKLEEIPELMLEDKAYWFEDGEPVEITSLHLADGDPESPVLNTEAQFYCLTPHA